MVAVSGLTSRRRVGSFLQKQSLRGTRQENMNVWHIFKIRWQRQRQVYISTAQLILPYAYSKPIRFSAANNKLINRLIIFLINRSFI